MYCGLDIAIEFPSSRIASTSCAVRSCRKPHILNNTFLPTLPRSQDIFQTISGKDFNATMIQKRIPFLLFLLVLLASLVASACKPPSVQSPQRSSTTPIPSQLSPPFFLSELTLLIRLPLAEKGTPRTFCKCTCFTNSTIIELGPHKDAPGTTKPPPATGGGTTPASNGAPQDSISHRSSLLEPRAASSSCTQCNRAFCLTYNLPICKGAEEKDVATSCFQRDSRKDQIIVWGFLIGTAGLLGWAGIRRALEARENFSKPARGGSGRVSSGAGNSQTAGGIATAAVGVGGRFGRSRGASGGGSAGLGIQRGDAGARGQYGQLT
jgi:hypothetical protein